ncbi:MAG: hypothetical protein A2X67_09115 [Ignavibacteria bacterium GWA2_55_11]|nr:MAG: hypothetical protein A2X67_09115 [Ignavibacteria bacterium GWA2_55_11]OGU47571.1 MAG: hypothetical protein A2X68_05915 [Ignavibacteria bacterium GWC2_56_12]
MDILSFPSTMWWPLAACLVLTGIHVYLGVHVIARKVIFVDLALAQIAALGTVIGVLMGYEVGKDTTALYLYSLTFTIFGAFVFSITKMKGERVPHEAIIGIVYAVTFAATILVLSSSALGPQELDHIIKGELLWVQGPTVLKTAAIYGLVGLFHFLFRKKFLPLSFGTIEEGNDMNVRVWDFLFYMSFGFVITSSVAIAGVFLVFSYLVIPAVGAMLLSEKLGTRLVIGWVGGALVSVLGVKMSYDTGLPTSPLVVVLLAGFLIVSAIIRSLRSQQGPLIALRNLGLYVLVAAVFFGGIWLFRKPMEDPLVHALHMLESPVSTNRIGALSDLSQLVNRRDEWRPAVIAALADQDAEVRKTAVDILVRLEDRECLSSIDALLKDRSDVVQRSVISAFIRFGSSEDADKLVAAASTEEDPEMKVSLLKTAVHLGNVEGLKMLADIIKEGTVFSEDAEAVIRTHIQARLPVGDRPRLAEWLVSHADRLRWNQSQLMFTLSP